MSVVMTAVWTSTVNRTTPGKLAESEMIVTFQASAGLDSARPKTNELKIFFTFSPLLYCGGMTLSMGLPAKQIVSSAELEFCQDFPTGINQRLT